MQRYYKRWRWDDSEPSRAESALILFMAMLGVLAAFGCATAAQASWQAWQWAVVAFVSFDLMGGVAAMSLPSAIKLVRMRNEPLRPLLFTALHIHPLVLALALPGLPWEGMFQLYGSALAGVALANLTPVTLRASVALSWTAAAVTLILSRVPTHGLEWLVPAYLLKLVATLAVMPSSPPTAEA